MRIFLFILLAILVGSCSTTQNDECDYRDCISISLKDFEWVKEMEDSGVFIVKEDSVFYSYPYLWHWIIPEGFKISRIDVPTGNFLDTIITHEITDIYSFSYPIDQDGWKVTYFMKDPSNPIFSQVNLTIANPWKSGSNINMKFIAIEVFNSLYEQLSLYEKSIISFENNEKYYLIDFLLYQGRYLILSFSEKDYKEDDPVYRLGLLDLKKLIDTY